ncbi:hypothetical protein K227x_39490 [Rubripirellula lacrimiformis]|uniref:Uncharacterized protein n=1 Tax=Rubripirellula lacrimiformis TaxID=1930273 RepID=A0A517NES9_9BACT|nr:hypothetical protein K227x_39490 [Rubripirellula lacrimiformis]
MPPRLSAIPPPSTAQTVGESRYRWLRIKMTTQIGRWGRRLGSPPREGCGAESPGVADFTGSAAPTFRVVDGGQARAVPGNLFRETPNRGDRACIIVKLDTAVHPGPPILPFCPGVLFYVLNASHVDDVVSASSSSLPVSTAYADRIIRGSGATSNLGCQIIDSRDDSFSLRRVLISVPFRTGEFRVSRYRCRSIGSFKLRPMQHMCCFLWRIEDEKAVVVAGRCDHCDRFGG